MNDALTEAAAATPARDALWRNPPPLATDCDHALKLLPVIEPRFTVMCRKCGGLDVETSRAIGSTSPDSPEYLILPDSSVRKLKDPPGREWAIRHPGGQITHVLQSRPAAESLRTGADLDCDECAGGTHALVYRDQPPWREAP